MFYLVIKFKISNIKNINRLFRLIIWVTYILRNCSNINLLCMTQRTMYNFSYLLCLSVPLFMLICIDKIYQMIYLFTLCKNTKPWLLQPDLHVFEIHKSNTVWLVCTAVITCSEPDGVRDATKTFDDVKPGSIVTYICNPGYTSSGDLVRTCSSTGGWSGV